MGNTKKRGVQKAALGLAKTHHKIRHTVDVTMSNVDLVKTGSALKLKLYDEGKLMGTLEMGRGSLFWTGAKRRRRYSMSWTEFADALNRAAYDE